MNSNSLGGSASSSKPTSPGHSSSKLGAVPIAPTSFNSAAFQSSPAQSRTTSFGAMGLQPTPAFQPSRPPAQAASGPNYSLDLPSQAPKPKPLSPQFPTFSTPLQPTGSRSPQPHQPSFGMGGMASPQQSMFAAMSSAPAAPLQPQPKPQAAAPPGWGGAGGLMQPTVAPKPAWNPSQASSTDWGDFDPLK